MKTFDKKRFDKHTSFCPWRSENGRRYERKNSDGSYIFFLSQIQSGNELRLYYLVDSDGNYVKDYKTFGSARCKQGALDTTYEGWVTLTPQGSTIKGRMVVSPYIQEGFTYRTYQN